MDIITILNHMQKRNGLGDQVRSVLNDCPTHHLSPKRIIDKNKEEIEKMQSWNKTRINYVPEMLVMEVLSKLTVKSLTRFRCVSKSWCSSFQTHRFITNHHQNNNLNILRRRRHGDTRIHYFSQVSIEKGQNFVVKHNIHLPFFEDCLFAPEVSDPCNGILCLHDYGRVAFWNPSTREFKTLPPSSVQRPPSASDTSFGCLGFGFDSQNNDYKVVRFITIYFVVDDHAYWTNHVELYSFNSDSWKEISDPEIDPHGSPLFNSSANGVCYWQVNGFDNYDLILSFDMVSEEFSTLPLPEFDGSLAESCLQLLDFNGLLGGIVYQWEGTNKCFDLWVMNGSWAKQFSIESVSGVERPLGFWKNNQLFIESSENELVLFDPSTRELKNLGIHAYPEKMQIIAYVESLVALNGRSEHEESIIRRPAGDASN